ncbi:hypothetical protein AB4Y30_15235 [Ornithinibacillus sp. 4-3]|uniref:Uncharacterized protein n=1 Tax=Ornithinibacillus sp. 4-3 TaxID=3231488 RepID=A0AB39HNT8_9BACI
MNKQWSEMNKRMQTQLNKTSFPEGMKTLLQLREIPRSCILKPVFVLRIGFREKCDRSN